MKSRSPAARGLCAAGWVAIVLLLAIRGPALGEVRLKKGSIEIVGSISQADVARLQMAFETARPEVSVVWLDSSGGELLAAMEMGRLIRRRHAYTVSYTHLTLPTIYSV